jgi:hypothetical protein
MVRFATWGSIALLLCISRSMALPNQCLAPSAENTFNAIENVPAPVTAALKKRFPNLQPTMAACPLVGPSSVSDRDRPCFVKAGAYGSRWVAVVSTRGVNAERTFTVISYVNGEAHAIGPGEDSLIPVCALNTFAGIQPVMKPKMRQKPALPTNAVRAPASNQNGG